jgi:AhpD family alkylhydroperoxidase
MGHYHDLITELAEPSKALRAAIPDTWAGLAQMYRAALGGGALAPHLKEVIALAVAVAEQCDGCIAYHARGAAAKGASSEEVAEALAVAVLMLGGKGTVYGPRAWQAFLEFSEK